MESATTLVAEEVWKEIASTHSVTDDQLSILHFLYGKNFEKATRIVDLRGVKRISGEPSQRSVFQVMGESKKKEEYFCFPQHFCACYSFFYDIVNRGEQLCCKHQLAARLAEAMTLSVEVKLSDEELALFLFNLCSKFAPITDNLSTYLRLDQVEIVTGPVEDGKNLIEVQINRSRNTII